MSDNKEQYIEKKHGNSGYEVEITFHDSDIDPDWDTSVITDSYIKSVFVLKGTLKAELEGQAVVLQPGHAMIMGPNVPHSLTIHGDRAYAYYSISCHPEFVLGPSGTDLYDSYINILSDRDPRFILFDGSAEWHNPLISLLNYIIDVNITRATGYELKTKSCLSMFTAFVVEQSSDTLLQKSAVNAVKTDQRIRLATNYIRAHYMEKISLDDIAASMSVSKSECCRSFRELLNVTPFEFLIKHRIAKAAAQLRDPAYDSCSITQIAAGTGFSSFSYFSKKFGKYMNCTPREYRNSAEDHNPSTDFMSFL